MRPASLTSAALARSRIGVRDQLYVAKQVGREQLADQYLYVSRTGGADQLEKRCAAILPTRSRIAGVE
jgi:hypothetical protein